MKLSHILHHLGEDRERYFNAVSPPVIQTSNFAFDDLGSFRQSLTNELDHHIYTRGNNPTVAILRQKLAALEGTEECLVFGSGAAAIAAAVLSQVRAGDHVVCVQAPYSWTKHLLTGYLPRFGVTCTFVDGTRTETIEAAVQPNTTVLYLESPNSLTFELQDLRACAELARRHGLTSIIDNSYSSPLYQQPAALGIDLVVHSGTKYLNGHSDVVLGVVCGSRDKLQPLFENEYMTIGAILSPHDAALVIRGLRTLSLRLERSHRTGLALARWLEEQPQVERVLHPWLESFPQHELARKQMKGTGGLFSVLFRAERKEQMEDFVHSLQRFLIAVSWGGHESLIMPSVAFYDIPGRADTPLPFQLVRFYIGLEEEEFLREDLQQALRHLS